MHFSVGFVVAAMALSAASSPVDSRRGTSIPIQKRITRSDGVVSGQWFRSQMARTQAKYDRGFSNFKKNTGNDHPLAAKRDLTKRGTGSNPLTDYSGELWYGSISVGTPAVTFTVDYDTGSSDLFLPGSDCTYGCKGHTLYNPRSSSSHLDVGRSFSLQYGDGSAVEGEQYTDVVTISGLTASKVTLGAANTYTAGFSSPQFPADGLLGMGYKSLSQYQADPVFQTMVSQGKTDAGVFAFKLSSSGASLYLGGTDRSLYTGNFTTVPVTQQGYWQVNLDGFSVGGTSVVNSTSSIIDTGTTLLIGPYSAVTSIVGAIKGAGPAPPDLYGGGVYMVACDSVPDISVTFGGTQFKISAATLNMGKVEGHASKCLLGVVGDDTQFWIIGDVFLQNVYTSFSLDNNQVGFATLA